LPFIFTLLFSWRTILLFTFSSDEIALILPSGLPYFMPYNQFQLQFHINQLYYFKTSHILNIRLCPTLMVQLLTLSIIHLSYSNLFHLYWLIFYWLTQLIILPTNYGHIGHMTSLKGIGHSSYGHLQHCDLQTHFPFCYVIFSLSVIIQVTWNH
jgi:hypothetical protein